MMSKYPSQLFAATRQSGMTLVELLVGMVIAMVGMLAMFQLMDTWEARKRTAASGSDAQTAGSIALYQLERDIRQAGYGFGNAANMGCTVSASDNTRATSTYTFTLAPIVITDGAGGVPDSLAVLYGDSQMSSNDQTFTAATTTSRSLNSRSGIMMGDLALVADSSATCRMVEITGNTNADGVTVDFGTTNYTNYYTGVSTAPRFNPSGGWAVTSTSGSLYNFGRADASGGARRNLWQIRSNGKVLGFCDDLHNDCANSTTAWQEAGDNIIDLQAQYGLDTDTPRNYLVDTWQATAPTAATWPRVIAVRVAVLARSQQYEKTNVTTSAPTWAGGSFVMRNVDGTTDNSPGDANDWRRYRYRVYQTTIPLRNAVWGTAP